MKAKLLILSQAGMIAAYTKEQGGYWFMISRAR